MSSIDSIFNSIKKFYTDLAAPFVGREEEAKLITLALLSKEHVILIGEPGTAKSALARRAAELLNAKFFMYLLTRYTEVSELFGTIDIEAMKKGIYRRVSKDRLPEAEIAFLDEIFNANSSLLNALLSLLNERKIFDGYNVVKTPLWTLIGASNTTPDEPELEALYDRLLLRHFTTPVTENMWKQLLTTGWELEFTDKWTVKQQVIDMKTLNMVYSELLPKVDLSQIINKLVKIFAIFEEKGIHLSDRRKVKALKVIAAHAIFNGRLQANEEDLMVLKYVAAKDSDSYASVSAILNEELSTPAKYMRELTEIYNNLKEIERMLNESLAPVLDSKVVDIIRSLRAARARVEALGASSGDEKVNAYAKEVINKIDDLMDKIAKKFGILGK